MKFSVFLTAFLPALLLTHAHSKDLFVAPNGKDTNAGSRVSPFATIARAAKLAKPGDTVQVRAGVYRETVKVSETGSKELPITFTAYQAEKVVLSGADPVIDWARHKGDIWKATVDWDAGRNGDGNTLFVDGKLKFEARDFAENDPLTLKDWGQIRRGGMKSEGFSSKDLKGRGDGFWNGAKVRHHTHDWVIRDSVIKHYDSNAGKITFETPVGVISQKHTIGFYIFGSLKALDKPGEWFKDVKTKTLYYQTEPRQNPDRLKIEFKRRAFAFDIRGVDHIRIHGFDIRGASIQTDANTDFSLIDGNTFYAYDKGGFGRFFLSGEGNVFRDNEVSNTWGGVVSISGKRNQLVNNYFHDIGFSGTARVLGMSGTEHLVSYNTVRRIARSFLDGFPYRSEFSHNLFEDGGRISWDTGFFDGDSGRGNGGGCTIHHNVFRNSPAIGIYSAIYAGNDLVIHHNIVHDITHYSVRAGRKIFLKYYQNTFIGPAPDGDVNAAATAIESNYCNNLHITSDQVASIGVEHRGNRNYKPEDFVDFKTRDLRLAKGSKAIDCGIVIPGINDGFKGKAPDCGAVEYGEEMWRSGHDFENPPKVDYQWTPLAGTNIFENDKFSMKPSGWTYTGDPTWINGNAWNSASTGLSALGGRSMRFRPGDGMSRVFPDLKPDTCYTVGYDVRIVDERMQAEKHSKSQGQIHQAKHRGESYVDQVIEGDWLAYENVDFGEGGKYDQLELAYSRPPKTAVGAKPATLEVRLDSPDGARLGEFTYNPALHDSWFTAHTRIPKTSGKHTVYLLPKGPGASSMRFDALRLLNSNAAPDDLLTIGARDFGRTDVSTRVGEPLWKDRYQKFTFKTGPSANSAEVFIHNDGRYDAYLDRFALYEKDEFALNITPSAKITQDPERSWWRVDLGTPQDVYSIRLTAPKDKPGQLSNFRVSAWSDDPENGGVLVWQNDYFTRSMPASEETLIIKPTDRSADGVTELKDRKVRFVGVQALGKNGLGEKSLDIAELEILAFDEGDLVASDGEVHRDRNLWEVSFGQLINIGEIRLFNRSDENHRHMKNLRVSVLDRDPKDGGKVVWQKDFLPNQNVEKGGVFSIPGDEIAADGTTRLASALGRVVRVESKSTLSPLALANVKILRGEDVRPKSNLALNGEASQSSVMYHSGGLPELGINGVVLPMGDFTSTRATRGAWWQVDLKKPSAIDQIVLFNRTDSASRIGNFRVSVWDKNPQDGGTELWGKNYSYAKGDLPAGGSLTINGSEQDNGKALGKLGDAQVVRVSLLGSQILSLAEVQVWTVAK